MSQDNGAGTEEQPETPKAETPIRLDEVWFAVRGDKMQRLADYLKTRPWAEVNALIVELHDLPRVDPPE